MSALLSPRGLRRIAVPATLALLVGGASVASAIPPGGVKDNPGGAVVTVAPADVAPGGKVVFTGTGFASGEVLSVKIDDGTIFKKGGTNDVLTEVTGAADGTVSGSIDLAGLNPSTPVANGAHWLRFLSGQPRSLRADFTVSVPGSGTPTDPGTPVDPGTPTNPGTPTTTTTPTAPVTAAPALIEITKTTVAVKKSKATLKLKAGTAGSAGTIRIRTLEKLKIGKGGKKQRLVFKGESYLVEKVATANIRLTLTADGKALLKKRKAFKAVAEITDATGEKLRQTITVSR